MVTARKRSTRKKAGSAASPDIDKSNSPTRSSKRQAKTNTSKDDDDDEDEIVEKEIAPKTPKKSSATKRPASAKKRLQAKRTPAKRGLVKEIIEDKPQTLKKRTPSKRSAAKRNDEPEEPTELSVDDVDTMTVKALKSELEIRNLSDKGRKAELVERLTDALSGDINKDTHMQDEADSESVKESSSESSSISHEKQSEESPKKMSDSDSDGSPEDIENEKPFREESNQISDMSPKKATKASPKRTPSKSPVRRQQSLESDVIESDADITDAAVDNDDDDEEEEEEEEEENDFVFVESNGPSAAIASSRKRKADESDIADVDDDDDEEDRPIKRTAMEMAASRALRLDGFVRPLRNREVEDLLGKYGEFEHLWMDKFKTHAYVIFTSSDCAAAARSGIHGLDWQVESKHPLRAKYVTVESALSHGSVADTLPESANVIVDEDVVMKPALNERQDSAVSINDTKTLDSLFKKTRTKPHLYFKPLTDDEIKQSTDRR